MIGPKQFDIRHKTKPKRDFDNPIVNKIFEPKFKYREGDLREIVESFVEKFKSPLFEFEDKEIKPLSRSIEIPNERHEKKFESIAGSFMDRFNVPKINKLKMKPKEKEEEEEKIELSEDMINRITYKVFQNIREYLRNDDISSGQKSIKLEIDF